MRPFTESLYTRDRNERDYFSGGDGRCIHLGTNVFKVQVRTSRWKCPVSNWMDGLRGYMKFALISM